MDKRVAIFCSASFDIDPSYNVMAREIVQGLCRNGFTIVSGGTVKGTMGQIAEEVVTCEGKHIGVIPRFMKELVYPQLTETIWTDTMAERKTLMREGTVATVSLPGGIGTLDEMIETLTLAKLGRYSGRVIVFNPDGFYEPLKALLDHYVATGMLDERSRGLVSFPETAQALVEELV